MPKHTGTASLGVLRTNDANLTVADKLWKARRPRSLRRSSPRSPWRSRSRTFEFGRLTRSHLLPKQIERIKNKLDDSYLAVGLSRAFPVPSYEGCLALATDQQRVPTSEPAMGTRARFMSSRCQTNGAELSRGGAGPAIRPDSEIHIHKGFRGFGIIAANGES